MRALIDLITQDLRVTVRTVVRRPGSASAAILTLGVGIGAATAMYSALEGVVLAPLPYPDGDRLVRIWSVENPSGLRQRASFPDFTDWRQQSRTLEVAGWGAAEPILTGAGDPERVPAILFVGELFQLLGVPPALGATAELDAARAGEPTVVLSHRLWQRRFGSDPDIVGKAVPLDGTPYTVAGVMPRDFLFPVQANPAVEAWVPLARFNPALERERGARLIEVIGRVRRGFALEAAQREMEAIAAGLSERYPDTNDDFRVALVPAIDEVRGPVSRSLWMLFAAAASLLVIACVNVAHILLVRLAGREHELAIRRGLGAGGGRLALQLMVEGLLISAAGGALGCGLAYFAVDVMATLIPAGLPRADQIAVDGNALAFAVSISVITGAMVGLAPAWRAARSSSPGTSRRPSGAPSGPPRGALVVFEIASTTVLLAGAGLLARSFMQLDQADPGFAPDHVLTFSIDLPADRYPRPAEAFQALQTRLLGVPGVLAASTGLQLPDRGLPLIDDTSPILFGVDGAPLPEDRREPIPVVVTQPGYFGTLGIPVVHGRDFAAGDDADAARVVVVNEAFAERYLAERSPIGRRISLESWTLAGERSAEVVGVAGNVEHRGLATPVQPLLYLPVAQRPRWSTEVVVRVTGDPSAAISAVRDAVRDFDPVQPIADIRPLRERIAESIARERFRAYWLGVFSALALLIASTGLYGVLSDVTVRRTRELGVRVALGAGPRQVWTLVVGQGLRWVVPGVVIGLAATAGLARLVEGFLFGIETSDPLTFLVVSVVLAWVALVACGVPARRATRIDPNEALRFD